MKMMNKKALEDTGYVWIVAIIAIVGVLFFYYLASSLIYSEKKLSEDEKKFVLRENPSSVLIVENFLEFLERKEGNKKIKELIGGDLQSNEKGFERFRGLSEEFLEDVDINGFETSWIRIYEKNEKIEKGYVGKYIGYQAVNIESTRVPYVTDYVGWNIKAVVCDPESFNAYVFFVLADDKKIVFCFQDVEKE